MAEAYAMNLGGTGSERFLEIETVTNTVPVPDRHAHRNQLHILPIPPIIPILPIPKLS